MKVAERIIEANDKSKAEVVVDIELLQINSQRLRDLGVSLSSYSIGQQLSVNGSGGTGTAGEHHPLPASACRTCSSSTRPTGS